MLNDWENQYTLVETYCYRNHKFEILSALLLGYQISSSRLTNLFHLSQQIN